MLGRKLQNGYFTTSAITLDTFNVADFGYYAITLHLQA